MTTAYYTTNSVGLGVRATVAGGNSLYVATGVVLGSVDQYAVGVGGIRSGVDIYGSVHGELGGMSVLNATLANINVWDQGIVGSSNEDSFGIAVNNSSAMINNFGVVSADIGIDVLLNSDCQILNAGEIRGVTAAFDIDATAVGHLALVNNGTISSALLSSVAYHSAGDVEEIIANRGQINGSIDLGPGRDRYYGTHAQAMQEGYFTITGAGEQITSFVSGDAGPDILIGGTHLDFFVGDGGKDLLDGAGGGDILVGSGGRDRLNGGGGADDFLYNAPGDSYGHDRDVIADFSRSQHDEIDLSAIDANVAVGGNQSFEFIGRHGFTGDAGELRYEFGHGRTTILMNVDGDQHAEIAIELDGHVSLAASDFHL